MTEHTQQEIQTESTQVFDPLGDLVDDSPIEAADDLEAIGDVEEQVATTEVEAAEDGIDEEITETVQEPEVLAESVIPTQDWVKHLAGVNELSITEFGTQKYNFRRLKDPTDAYTDKFAVFLEWSDSPDEWEILNGMLSDRYAVASLEQFTNHFSQELDLDGVPSIRFSSFNSMWIGDLVSPIDIWEDETAKIVFALVTGVPIESLDNISSKVSVMAVNSYNGAAKIRLDYSLVTTGNVNGSRVKFRDYFSVVKHSTKVVHGHNLGALASDVLGIRRSITGNIEALKATDCPDELIETIATGFSADGRNMMLSTWEGMGSEKNMYYAAIVASLVLDAHWSMSSYTRVRRVMEKAFSNVLVESV